MAPKSKVRGEIIGQGLAAATTASRSSMDHNGKNRSSKQGTGLRLCVFSIARRGVPENPQDCVCRLSDGTAVWATIQTVLPHIQTPAQHTTGEAST